MNRIETRHRAGVGRREGPGERAREAAPILGPGERHAEKLAPHSRKLIRLVVGAIAFAWLTGFGARALWLAGQPDNPRESYAGHRLLSTADAYYYATGVLAETTGFPAGNPRVPGAADSLVVALGAAVASVFALPVEAVCLWMPAVLAPLVALPLILLGMMLGQTMWAFLAALVSVLGYSYWNRSIPGYFDTDMVSIPYVYGLAALVVAAFWRKKSIFGAFAAALAVAAPYVHLGSERVLLAVTLGALAYTFVFARKEAHGYRVVWFLAIAFSPLPIWARLLAIAALEIGLRRVRLPLAALIGATVATVLVVGLEGSGAISIRYYFVDAPSPTVGPGGSQDLAATVSFPDVGATVSELGDPDVGKLGERVAGHVVLLVTGLLGALAMCWRYRPLLLLGPLIVAGTLFATTGQRYTIYAVPAIAMGNVWLAIIIGRFLARRLRAARPRVVELGAAALLTTAPVSVAAAHGLGYPSNTVINADEASQLVQLGALVEPGDFVIAWWDYAYAIWYHTGARTIIDGAKQNRDTWFSAEILFTSSQREAAGLARMVAEKQVPYGSLETIMSDVLNGWHDTSGQPASDFVPSLREGRAELPPATRAVYLYLPWRFIRIMPAVAALRPARGLVPDDELSFDAFLRLLPNAGNRPESIADWTFDRERNVLRNARGAMIEVYKDVEITTNANRVFKREGIMHEDGRACVVRLRHTDMLLFMSRDVYESVFAQLLFLVQPDPRFFKLVSYGRGGAIYRIML